MRLTIELLPLPEAHADPEPEGWTRGHVVALLRAAGYRPELVRTPQPGDRAVDDSWGLGPGAVAALAEARAAFEATDPDAELHHCPVAGCTYGHRDRRGVATHLRNHDMAECPGCGRAYKAGGLGAHRRHCRGEVLPEPAAPPPVLAVRTTDGVRIDHVPDGVHVQVNGHAAELPADLGPGDELTVVSERARWVSVPIERRPFDADAARRRAAEAL